MLAPVDCRSEGWLRQLHDFALVRKAPELRFTEDQALVKRYFEAAVAAGSQRDIDQDGRPGTEDFRRQTDGLLEIVSGDAKFNRDPMLGIEHRRGHYIPFPDAPGSDAKRSQLDGRAHLLPYPAPTCAGGPASARTSRSVELMMP